MKISADHAILMCVNGQLTHPIHSVEVGASEAPGERVVFLHGLFGRGKNFTTIASGLGLEVQSLLVDLPNHGRSGWTDGFDYPRIADLIADHLREGFAAAAPIDLVGHSMGGKVAMVLALRHPDLVRRLVVIDMAPVSTAGQRSEFPELLEALAGVDLGRLERRLDAHEALRASIPNSTVRGFLLQNLRRGDAGFEWEPNLGLLHEEIDAVMSFPDMTGARFDGPVLWVGGERSGYITDADEPAMRALFPRTVRMTVKGVGHWVHSEAPDTVIGALRRFLLDEG